MPHKIGHVGRIDVVMRHVGVVQHSLSFAAWGGCGGVVVWWCGGVVQAQQVARSGIVMNLIELLRASFP